METLASLPSREAWIEITLSGFNAISGLRRFPRGKRGLKYLISSLLGNLAMVASLAGSVD